MPNRSAQRNPLAAWWIGLAIILAVVGYAAYRFACPDCTRIGLLPELMVLAVIPAVYLALMYLTLKSQAEIERE